LRVIGNHDLALQDSDFVVKSFGGGCNTSSPEAKQSAMTAMVQAVPSIESITWI
jgi:hypothetical protein